MVRTYNIGTECYALITSTSEPEFLLPVKVVILEKYTLNDSATYKVKIKEIYETNFSYLKEHFGIIRMPISMKSENRITLLKKLELESTNSMSELIQKLNDNLNALCLEIRDIKTKTTTLVWVWKVLTSFPAKFAAAVGAASGIIYYILNYFKI